MIECPDHEITVLMAKPPESKFRAVQNQSTLLLVREKRMQEKFAISIVRTKSVSKNQKAVWHARGFPHWLSPAVTASEGLSLCLASPDPALLLLDSYGISQPHQKTNLTEIMPSQTSFPELIIGNRTDATVNQMLNTRWKLILT